MPQIQVHHICAVGERLAAFIVCQPEITHIGGQNGFDVRSHIIACAEAHPPDNLQIREGISYFQNAAFLKPALIQIKKPGIFHTGQG